MANPIRCCNCGKKIAEHAHIVQGFVKIKCKCGTVNEVKALSDPTKRRPVQDKNGNWVIPMRGDIDLAPYGERMEASMTKKDRLWGGDPLNTSQNAIT